MVTKVEFNGTARRFVAMSLKCCRALQGRFAVRAQNTRGIHLGMDFEKSARMGNSYDPEFGFLPLDC